MSFDTVSILLFRLQSHPHFNLAFELSGYADDLINIVVVAIS